MILSELWDCLNQDLRDYTDEKDDCLNQDSQDYTDSQDDRLNQDLQDYTDSQDKKCGLAWNFMAKHLAVFMLYPMSV